MKATLKSKYLLLLACLLFLVPFFIFSGWSYPTNDDYIIGVRRQTVPFWTLQQFYYETWSGRYLSTLVSSLFAYTGLQYRHYHLIPAGLLLATVAAWMLLLQQVNKFVLARPRSFLTVSITALLLLVLQLVVVPEVNTNFYWFSSAITYQLSLIVTLLFCAVLIRCLQDTRYSVLRVATLFLLIACIHGGSEFFSLAVLLFSIPLVALSQLTRQHRALVLTLFCWSLVCAGFLLLAPGVRHRSSLMGTGTMPLALGFSVVRFMFLNWYFLKEPLWWGMAFLVAGFARSGQLTASPLFDRLRALSWQGWLLLYVALGTVMYIPVLYKTNGSLPMRAENVLVFLFALFALLVVYFRTGAGKREGAGLSGQLMSYRYFLLAVLVFCTPRLSQVAQTLVSGYLYNEVMAQRAKELEAGHKAAGRRLTIDGYDLALQKQIASRFPTKGRASLLKLIRQKPSLLFFEDNLANKLLIQRFYGLDTVIVREK